MPQKTPLYDSHVAAGALLTDFAGWHMPVHYGSLMREHESVRNAAGMFDVSHMTIVDIQGSGVQDFLRYLLANDVARLDRGKALYTCMLNTDGGVIDDLIVYCIDAEQYRMVVNAATHDKDMAWIAEQGQAFDIRIFERDDLAMVAVQGPEAVATTLPLLPGACRASAEALGRFEAALCGEWCVARTGYTGEDGYEIMLPAAEAPTFWEALHGAGVQPAGLGARDTLRLEAGMSLYGNDMDESVTPLESGLGWTVAWEPAEREFIGRAALTRQREAGVKHKMAGLLLQGRGVLRAHQTVFSPAGEGEVTSGTYSPSLKRSIALARIPRTNERQCEVEIRGRRVSAEVVKYPFIRNGKPTF